MKHDASKFKPFHMHFSLHIEYTIMKKYLVNKKEIQLIIFLKTNIKLWYNVLRGCPSCDPIYWKQRRWDVTYHIVQLYPFIYYHNKG